MIIMSCLIAVRLNFLFVLYNRYLAKKNLIGEAFCFNLLGLKQKTAPNCYAEIAKILLFICLSCCEIPQNNQRRKER